MPQKGFDYRRRKPWIAWGAKREWPALNPLPQDPNTYIYISSEHTTDPPEEVPAGDSFWPMPGVLGIGDPSQPLSMAFTRTELGSFSGNNNWPTANRAIFWPLTITEDFTVAKAIIYNGDAAAGNVDVGIYSLAGTKLASTGSTASSGVSVCQAFTLSYTLTAGSYFLAVASDTSGATQHWRRANFNDAQRANLYGMAQMDTAFPLPATATLAEVASGSSWVIDIAIAKSGAFL